MTSGISLTEKLSTFDDRWSPRTVALFNEHDVMVVKIEGPFNWHKHDDTDDFFYVLKGNLTIELEGVAPAQLGPGDLYIVPRGQMHRPVADGEVHLLLIEKTGTPNSGDPATAAQRQVI
jgi:mannose-6-phosphate isomerase-like protein (cupin superfamily)